MAMVSFWRGPYSRLPLTRDDNTLYFVESSSTEAKSGLLYLGDDLVADLTADSEAVKEIDETIDSHASQIENINNTKAEKSIAVAVTLTAAGWTVSGDVVSQIATVSDVTAASNIFVSLSQGATAEQISAFSSSLVKATAVNEGTVTFNCMSGITPTIDLPIVILIMG